MKVLLVLCFLVQSFIVQAQSGLLFLMADDAAFTPASVTSATLLGWYDFSDATQLSLTGSNIDTLFDKSGNGNKVYEISGNKPALITGQNGLTVSDNGILYRTGNTFSGFTAATDEVTFFIVAKFDATDSRALIDCTDGATNRGFNFFAFSNVLYLRAGGANEATEAFSDVTNYHIFSAIHSPALRTLYIDGTSVDANSTSQNMAATPTNLYIGALSGGSLSMDGQIGEIIIYKGAISDAERILLETYLNDKWAIY